jgi:hypothetical protein
MDTDSESERSMNDADMWANNTDPGPNYTPRVVTLPHFKPILYGRVEYDYIACLFTFTVVKDCGNGVYVTSTMNFGTLEMANWARRVISMSLGIKPNYIFGIEPAESQEAGLPTLLQPKQVTR